MTVLSHSLLSPVKIPLSSLEGGLWPLVILLHLTLEQDAGLGVPNLHAAENPRITCSQPSLSAVPPYPWFHICGFSHPRVM